MERCGSWNASEPLPTEFQLWPFRKGLMELIADISEGRSCRTSPAPVLTAPSGTHTTDSRKMIGGNDLCPVEELLQRLAPVAPTKLDFGGCHRQCPQDAGGSPRQRAVFKVGAVEIRQA